MNGGAPAVSAWQWPVWNCGLSAAEETVPGPSAASDISLPAQPLLIQGAPNDTCALAESQNACHEAFS